MIMTRTRMSIERLINSLQYLIKETDMDKEGIITGVDFVYENSQEEREEGLVPGSVLLYVKNTDGNTGTLYITPERASDVLQ